MRKSPDFKGFGFPHSYSQRKINRVQRILQKDCGKEIEGGSQAQGGNGSNDEFGIRDANSRSEKGNRQIPLHLQGQRELCHVDDPARLSSEWIQGSSVDPEIVTLNVESLTGYQPFERLFYSDKIQRLNTGRLPNWILKKYAHVERGGWWCSGVNPATGSDDLWGCFKPDHPRIDAAKGKHQKYEHPLKAQATLFALRVSDAIWQKVASRYGVEVLPTDIDEHRGDRGFWAWVIRNHKVDVTLTEGAKKAASLLSQGFAAIGLPGIWGAYRKNDGLPSLIPQAQCFATKGRKIYFGFDQDEKRSTRQTNRKAVWCTARLLKDKGCDTRIIAWEPWIKGVDDLIVAKGGKHFTACYQRALAFDDWLADGLRELTYKPALRLDSSTKYIGDFAAPHNAKLIALKAPKGSGKTEWLVNICAEAQNRGQKVLVLTHRTQLGKALCDRFGIDYVEELGESTTKGVFGIGLCFDSLRQNSKAKFDPEDWHNCIVILDEVEQSVWHLLNANTEVGKHRVQVLRNFQQLIQNVIASEEGKVYLSDADLSDVTIDYIRSLISFPIEPWIAIKEGNPTPWDVTVWDCSKEMLGVLINRIGRGEKVLIFVDGQKAKSKWGTQNLEAYLSKEFPDLKILRVDAESVSTPGHAAYDCIDKLDETLKDFDICIASPTIETGVSIDLKGHFTSVWDFAQGVIPVPSVLQRMARLREPVPRHVWSKGYGIGRIGNGSTSPKRLIAGQSTKFQAHVKQLAEADFTFDFESAGNFQPQSLKTWAKMAARINLGMVRYQHEIIRALVAEGHQISSGNYESATDEEAKGLDQIKEELGEVRDKNYQRQCYEISKAPNPDSTRLQALQQKKTKSIPERLEQRKGELSERYDESLVNSKLVELDDDGEYPKAQLHYYLTVGEEFLPEREKTRMEKLLEAGENELFFPDANRSLIGGKLAYLKALGILELLARDTEWSNQSQVLIDLAIKTKQFRNSIKDVLGVSFNFERIGKNGEPLPPSPISIGQKYLKECLGLKFSDPIQRGTKGNQQRFYQPVEVSELRQKILASWRQRDEQRRATKLAESAPVASPQVISGSSVANSVSQLDTVNSTGNIYRSIPAVDQTAVYQSEDVNGSSTGDFVSSSDTVNSTGNIYRSTTAVYQNAVYQGEGGNQVVEPSQGVATEPNRLADLVAMLSEEAKDSQTFVALIKGFSPEMVEEAIALQDTQHRRKELQQWFAELAQAESTAGGELAQSPVVEDTAITDARYLRSVTDWHQVTLSQARLDEAWRLLDVTEQNRLHELCQTAQQPVERQWGITRAQAEMGGAFEWIRGGLVRVVVATADFVRLATGDYVNYQELRVPG